jgi:hypothetical protein
MFKGFRSRLTYANVASSLALFIAVGTGGAYAANTVGSGDIIDESIQTNDIKDGEVRTSDIGFNQVFGSRITDDTIKSADIADGRIEGVDLQNGSVVNGKLANNAVTEPKIAADAVNSAKVLDDTVVDGGLAAPDLQANSVGSSEIATDAVQATEVANDSIDAGEIVDFGLSNQDVGVLFAQVNADSTLANSSGGVTTVNPAGVGTYEVDFGRNISGCAFTATQGDAGAGSSIGAIIGVTDRSGNAEAVFVSVKTDTGAAVDRGFQLIVVC